MYGLESPNFPTIGIPIFSQNSKGSVLFETTHKLHCIMAPRFISDVLLYSFGLFLQGRGRAGIMRRPSCCNIISYTDVHRCSPGLKFQCFELRATKSSFLKVGTKI